MSRNSYKRAEAPPAACFGTCSDAPAAWNICCPKTLAVIALLDDKNDFDQSYRLKHWPKSLLIVEGDYHGQCFESCFNIRTCWQHIARGAPAPLWRLRGTQGCYVCLFWLQSGRLLPRQGDKLCSLLWKAQLANLHNHHKGAMAGARLYKLSTRIGHFVWAGCRAVPLKI